MLTALSRQGKTQTELGAENGKVFKTKEQLHKSQTLEKLSMAKEYLDELDYYASRIAKLKNNKYEYYVVTRLIHLLDEPEIEFRTQQYVKIGENYRLIDLYFPQFKLAVEVDELGHMGAQEQDVAREKEIFEVLQSNFYRVSVDENRSLSEMNSRIQEIIEEIKRLKKEQEQAGTFKKFDFNGLYDVNRWLERGVLSVSDDARFRRHIDALKLVGKDYKGHQSATAGLFSPKNLGEDDGAFVAWFPKLYKNGVWNNQLMNEGTRIEAHTTDNSPYDYETHDATCVVFFHFTDELNQTYYKFQGVFDPIPEESHKYLLVYKRVSDKIFFDENDWWY